MKVKLEDIIEAMEFAGMEIEYYYDTQSEKVRMLFESDDSGWIEEINKILEQ